jgi:guanine deaminase
MSVQAYRAQILSFQSNPQQHGSQAVQYERDGLLLVENGKITACGAYHNLQSTLPADCTPIDYRGKLIVPGFIDTHVHYPQTDIIASPAPGLLPWLEQYTFPAERRFADPAHAASVAEFFLDELIGNGTTSALVYCTVHPQSAEALFAASHARNMRMVAGKVLMDRHCPDFLQDTAEQGVADSEALIKRWHGTGRQLYAITPRFAPTSTRAQLQLAGELASRYPDTFIQTHVAENHKEIEWARELFPEARSYLAVYEQFGLLRQKTVLGHGIYLDDGDLASIHERGASIAVCPTSNLFLGSGLFDFARAEQAKVQLSLATDVGGGTSFSMLRTMAAAYNIACLKGVHLSAMALFYMATLGAAKSLGLSHQIGHLRVGAEADFIVLDHQATPLLARRSSQCNSLEEMLFVLALLGDDRTVAATYVAGKLVKPSGK